MRTDQNNKKKLIRPLTDGLGFCRKIQINNVHPEKICLLRVMFYKNALK